MAEAPLAERVRPTSFDDMVGQEHLFGENGTIRKICAGEYLPNMIFYGPPGTGKTTAARNQNPYGSCWAFSATSACESSF